MSRVAGWGLRLAFAFAFALVACVIAVVAFARPAFAAAADCGGPDACCISDPAKVTTPLPTHVRMGMRIRRIGNIDEQAAKYEAELTLLSHWPAGGLRPDPKPRNAGSDFTVALDEVRMADGVCYREQRYNGSFLSWFRLRRFPFDSQNLRLNLEDREHTDEQMIYEKDMWPNTISADAYREIGGWKIEDYPHLTAKHSTFAYPDDAPHPMLVLIEIPVQRQWRFYVTRFFLPLFLIVVLAYCLFWIKPEDLGSASSIGITCVLAIITFQITQADRLPKVPYMTIADIVYVICYAATGLAVVSTIREAYLASSGRTSEATALDKRMRWLFPVLVVVAIGLGSLWGWRAEIDPSADVPHRLAAAAKPVGET
ncbi:hypothetical protein BH09MYX1_BH09MYX1_21020 [soil metagenome]